MLSAFLAVAVFALVFLVVLLVGGPVLIGIGVYFGVSAYRVRAAASSTPIPTPNQYGERRSRKVFGLRPSYGLSAACILLGAAMFVGGVALLGNSDAPSQTAFTSVAAQPARPSSLATWSPPPTSSSPSSTAPAPASGTVVNQPQATEAAAPIESSPTRPPAKPRPTTPKPSERDDEPFVYYKNCAAARAAGVTPIQRGEPGYRPGLDRDHDGVACEK